MVNIHKKEYYSIRQYDTSLLEPNQYSLRFTVKTTYLKVLIKSFYLAIVVDDPRREEVMKKNFIITQFVTVTLLTPYIQ